MRYDEAWNAVVGLAASRHGVFHAAEAAEMGVSQERLRRAARRGALRQPHRRVYVLGSTPPSRQQELHVASIATLGSDLDRCRQGAISHCSAAAVHGYGSMPHQPVALWVPDHTRLRASPYEVHRGGPLDPAQDITMIDGIRVVNAAANLCQLGSCAPEQLERALDTFSRQHSMRWLQTTADRWRRSSPKSTAGLDRVLNDPRRFDGVTDSWMERVIAGLLLHRDLPPVVTQYEVTINGRTYRIDIAIPDVLLGVEAHSREFHWGPGQVDADNVRDLQVSAAGWQLLYVTWWQSQHPDEFVDFIVAAVRARQAFGFGSRRTA